MVDYDGITEHSLTRHIIRLDEPTSGFNYPRYGRTLCGRTVHFTNSRHRRVGNDECPACARVAWPGGERQRLQEEHDEAIGERDYFDERCRGYEDAGDYHGRGYEEARGRRSHWESVAYSAHLGLERLATEHKG